MTEDISMKNTKKELLEIIQKIQQETTEKEKGELNPEKVRKEIQTKETIEIAENITQSDLSSQIHDLKTGVNRELSALAEKIETEAKKYTTLQEAIKLKQAEVEEIYGIEKQAASLAVLLESQNQVNIKFETEMSLRKEKLEKEIAATKVAWETEKKSYKESLTEKRTSNEKERQREEDEYIYSQKRTRTIEENSFADTLTALEKEIEEKSAQIEKDVREKTAVLNDREQQISEREKTMNQLEMAVDAFPNELETAIKAAIEVKEKELSTFFKQDKALLTKGLEGEQKVLEAKIAAFESLVKDQARQIEKLNNQQEKAYQQVQDIAAKAVTGIAGRPQAITIKTAERDTNS